MLKISSRTRGIGLLTAGLLATLIAGVARSEYDVVEDIVAIVEDEAITVSDVSEQLQVYLLELQIDPQGNPDLVDSLQTEVLRQLVDNLLVVKEAERQGIEVSDEQIEFYLERQMSELKERFGGGDAFKEQLELEGVSLREMEDFYREDIRRQLLSSQLVGAEIDTDVEVTDAEIRTYWEEHKHELPRKEAQIRLRHLLIAPKPSAEREVEAQQTMNDALERVRSGEDFATVAREVSQDPTAERGGDIGFFRRGDLADEIFTQAAFALTDGEISDIVRSAYGYHIILRVESRGDEIRVRHIVVPHATSDSDKERAQALMDTVEKRLAEGADFVDMIRAYSDAPEADGDVGFFPMDGLFPHYRTAVQDLEVGQISDVIEDEQGYHLFQVMERSATSEYTFEEVEPQLRELLSRERVAKQYRIWVDKLRERSYVDVRSG